MSYRFMGQTEVSCKLVHLVKHMPRALTTCVPILPPRVPCPLSLDIGSWLDAVEDCQHNGGKQCSPLKFEED